jgi:Peptidase family M23
MSTTTRLAALVIAPAVALGGCMSSLLLLDAAQQSQATVCGTGGPATQIDLAAVPTGPISGYGSDQLVNAAYIMNAAFALGLDRQAQTIGVMTAMGESTLVVVDHGDSAGPDSRGLFQQRASGAWGSYADRMDPFISATNFFAALMRVDAWEALEPTIAAHRVQGNADPYHYESFWTPAVAVVDALASAGVVNATPAAAVGGTAGSSAATCANSTGDVSVDGWTKPAVGPVTSNFGMRVNPVTGVYRLHSGTDIGAACGAAIYAAADGTVIQAGAASGYGNLIAIDHGSTANGLRVVSRYGHMYNSGLLTRVGATVAAGQQIARVGSNGNSTGCHLHFEIRLGNEFTDPAPFMSAHGAPLG